MLTPAAPWAETSMAVPCLSGMAAITSDTRSTASAVSASFASVMVDGRAICRWYVPTSSRRAVIPFIMPGRHLHDHDQRDKAESDSEDRAFQVPGRSSPSPEHAPAEKEYESKVHTRLRAPAARRNRLVRA